MLAAWRRVEGIYFFYLKNEMAMDLNIKNNETCRLAGVSAKGITGQC